MKAVVFKPTSVTKINNSQIPTDLEIYQRDSLFSQYFNQQTYMAKVGFSYGQTTTLVTIPANQDFYVTYYKIDAVAPPFAFLNADATVQLFIQVNGVNVKTLGLSMVAFRSDTGACVPAIVTCNPTIPLKISGPCTLVLNSGVANAEATANLYGYMQSKSPQSN